MTGPYLHRVACVNTDAHPQGWWGWYPASSTLSWLHTPLNPLHFFSSFPKLETLPKGFQHDKVRHLSKGSYSNALTPSGIKEQEGHGT